MKKHIFEFWQGSIKFTDTLLFEESDVSILPFRIKY